MSQVPQPPPPTAPPGSFGGFPPPGGGPRTNGPAIASLILGLLGCIPLLGSLLAIVLGFVGIRKARDPQVGGKGLAIAGIILGVLWLGIYAAFGGTILAVVRGTAAERETAKAFVTDLAAGKVDAVAARNGDALNRGDLLTIAETLQRNGRLVDVTTASFNYSNGVCTVGGVATFDQTQKAFELTMVERGEDQWQVTAFQLR